MISVCMATYNGGKYIRAQLDSILMQLGPTDEIVVCDDCSSDDTLEVIESYRDARIRAYRNDDRLGHVRNFEKAITLSRGEYIFLSDQDDVWLQGRMAEMFKQIDGQDRVLLVASNFDLIDSDGADIGTFRQLGPASRCGLFQVLAIFAGKAPYYGCTFVLKRELVKYCLPIPTNIESHDIWIAMVANLFGRVVNMQGATVKRRIHQSNLTAKRRRALKVVLRSRYHFFQSLMSRAFCLKFGNH